MEDMEGVASIALLPSGSISGHFVHPLSSTCLGLFGTQIACERECSRGEDYRLINLTILDYTSKREKHVVMECSGQDAARMKNAVDIHGWEEDVMQVLESCKKREDIPSVTFECEILKANGDAEEHIRRYLPALAGLDAIVNIGKMRIGGLKFDTSEDMEDSSLQQGMPLSSPGIEGSHLSSRQPEFGWKASSASLETCDSSSMPLMTGQNSPQKENETAMHVIDELEAEGFSGSLSMHRWEEGSSGWRTKR